MRVMTELRRAQVRPRSRELDRAAVIGPATTTLEGGPRRHRPGRPQLSQFERINTILIEKLDSETERWGLKVTNVEILGVIEPPLGRGPEAT